MQRREAVEILASAPLATALTWTADDVATAWRRVGAARAAESSMPFQPQFFTPHEYETVGVLVDLLIPRDTRSGSASDAGVPAFMDFIVGDQENRQTVMRGGLAWLDSECLGRFGSRLVECTEEERQTVLDDIAWPARAPKGMRHGVAFFNGFRDLTATGFWSSRMGVADLKYMGNRALPNWSGCPEDQLRKLGVSYE